MTSPDELADALFLKAKLDFRQDQAAVYADELRSLARASAKAALTDEEVFVFTRTEMKAAREWLDVFQYEYPTVMDENEPLVRRIKDYTSE